MKPGKDCLGFFDECDGAGQFYWFVSEIELKYALLNGWYARQTEERDADYYDGAALLGVILELSEGIDKLWIELPGKLDTECQILWSGKILQLLTDENELAEYFRKDFKDFLMRTQTEDYDDYDPLLLHNNAGHGTPSPELLELLFEFLEDYCWG